MNELKRALHGARLDAEAVQDEIKKLEDELSQLQTFQELQLAKETLKAIKSTVESHELALRFEALEAFDGENKQVSPGLTVKEYTVLEYDPDTALTHAVDHGLYKLLNLDKRAFEAAAKSGMFEFVLETKQPRVTIARDLSAYLD